MNTLTVLALFATGIAANEPMLLKNYQGHENLSGWVMSEKLDGVRALWDTKTLKSRKGLAFTPPENWKKCFPSATNLALDGELYSPKLKFEEISAIVNSHNDKGWHKLQYHVFDVPKAAGSLNARLKKLEYFLAKTHCPQIVIIQQRPAVSHENVRKFLDEVVAHGGEGVVVRDEKAPYVSGRSDKILKLKKSYDSECEVIAHNGGKGRLKGMLGSLTCKDIHNGATFKIGSGLNDAVRRNPPAIGAIVTYKYQNLTPKGRPRFPVYLRERNVQF